MYVVQIFRSRDIGYGNECVLLGLRLVILIDQTIFCIYFWNTNVAFGYIFSFKYLNIWSMIDIQTPYEPIKRKP